MNPNKRNFTTAFLEKSRFDPGTLRQTNPVKVPAFKGPAPWPMTLPQLRHRPVFGGGASRQLAAVLNLINKSQNDIVMDPSTNMGRTGDGEPVNVQFLPDVQKMRRVSNTSRPADLYGREELLFIGHSTKKNSYAPTHDPLPASRPQVVISLSKLNALMKEGTLQKKYETCTTAMDILNDWHYFGVQIHDAPEDGRSQHDMRAVGVTIHNRVIMPNIWLHHEKTRWPREAGRSSTRLYLLLTKVTGEQPYWKFEPHADLGELRPPRKLYSSHRYMGACILVGIIVAPAGADDGNSPKPAQTSIVRRCLHLADPNDVSYRDEYRRLPKIEIMLVND